MPPSDEWSTGKTMGVWSLQLLLALAFLFSGAFKLAGTEKMVEMFAQIGVGQWFRYVTGVFELGGAATVLYPPTAPYGGLLIACVMVGAVFTHLFVVGGSPAVPTVLLGLALAVAWFRRT